jgi:iron complex transport system substrate-binding protein
VRIVSLLPSATEIVYALGLGDRLEAVTFECDHPPEARAKPVVSTSTIGDTAALSAGEIDAAVTESVARGAPLYRLDAERIAAIAPDVILTQDLCRVCAVPSGDVEGALAVIGCRSDVVSLDPSTLDDVIASIGVVGAATGAEKEAQRLMDALRSRLDAVRTAVRGLPRPRVFPLEWSDPPFGAGHWVADMVDAAGGDPVLTTAGRPSERLGWDVIAASRPDVVVFMPCGYGLAAAVAEGRTLLRRDELAGAARVLAVDADGCFSRPGPRLVDGVEALARALHPDASSDPAEPAPPIVATLR